VQLYRIMANVRAGADQPNAERGQLGLVTVWVRSDSESDALERARRVVEERGYESVAKLTAYLEQTSSLASVDELGQADTRGGYLDMRQQAINRGDGLFELWYPEEPNESAN
jgi:hypothetical protein